MEVNIQEQYDLIRSYFKTTTEPFDELDWDGDILLVLLDGKITEKHIYNELKEIIEGI